jgi:phage shock protein A
MEPRRKDPTNNAPGGRATGVIISERDPERQIQRARRKALSDLIQARDKIDKAIAIAEAHQTRN